MHYRLVAVNTIAGLSQTSWRLHLPATIGRHPEHEVSINHESISRSHCRLSLNADGALSVHDSSSMNGTYVDDEKIKHAVLLPGNILQVGAISFRVEYDEDAEKRKPESKELAYDLSPTVPMRLNRNKVKSESAQSRRKWWQFW